MADTHRSVRRATLLASAVAVLGLLTGCGNGSSNTTSTPDTLPGTAGPATGTSTPASASPTATQPSATPETPGTPSSSAPAEQTRPATSTRCHTSELRASVGRVNPGAGQRNYPIVLTNTSSSTCTVRGYPGAAFVDASGKQLGPDPKRSDGSPTTVTLTPGSSAWAGLSYSSPEISGARTATPDSLLVTPPDERDPLKVAWTAGEVPVGGNESSVFLTVFSPGTGA
ncbi:DUF4232 domain-containing protein [Streptomyces sp. DG2A-72]|uniref:DUF4232 domain-containing protein n=1 Tax=Streptomyces sp. DG2A-72 TaxID=3051386 RepID=UPI00265BA5CC|nr:DUF4232 domain-containing protein [Streptomyces sp. DG2A-72]MDO0938705.1 DUF4232 domain-containing protein [Streptomyces sp. DG2A-72]